VSEEKSVTGTVETAEKPVTYNKKAQIVGLTLFALLFVGLIFQTIHNINTEKERRTSNDAKDKLNKPTVIGQNQQSIDQFKEAQDQAKAELDNLKNAKLAQGRHEKDLSRLTDGSTDPNQLQPNDEEKQNTIAEVYRVFDLKETERVLKARSAEIGFAGHGGTDAQSTQNPASAGFSKTGFSNASGTVGAAAISPEIARVQGLIESNNKQITDLRVNAERLMTLAQQKPSEIYPQTAGQSTTNKTAGTRADSMNSGEGRVNNDEFTFGQTANNRAISSPGNTGPRPGEKIIPTTTTFSAILQQDVISDYPNNWIAVLQRPVYDIERGDILLPTGTKIMGGTVKASEINEAIQNRLGFFVNVIERGDGKRIDLKNGQGLDAAGIAGLKGDVNYHIWAQMLGVAAYAVIGLGPSTQDFGTKPFSASSQAVTDMTTKSRQIGRDIAQKYLSIVPTVTIHAGTPIKIILQDDLYVTPWQHLTTASYRYAP
jgi:type IV secretion system protein VirB10